MELSCARLVIAKGEQSGSGQEHIAPKENCSHEVALERAGTIGRNGNAIPSLS